PTSGEVNLRSDPMRFPSSCRFAAAVGAAPLLAVGLALAGESPRAVAVPGLPQATRGPERITFTPDGRSVLITESDTGTLAVVDRAERKLLRRLPTGGGQPNGVAVDSNGSAVIANSQSGTIVRLNLESGAELARLDLRGEPVDVVLSQDRRRAFVSLAQLDEVAVLDLPSLAVRSRIAVGDRPRAMALTPDGRTLLAANFQGGDVSVIDTAALRETRRIPVRGVNLRGITVAPGGGHAFVTGQAPAETRVTWVALDVWVNTLFRIELDASAPAAGSEGRLDFTTAAAPDPRDVAALDDERVVLTVSGSDEALLVRAPEPHQAYFDPAVQQRAPVGAQPRGLALSPDRRQIWIANHLGSSVSVLDAATLRPIERIDLVAPDRPDPRLPGRYFFGNAGMTAGRQFTCSSCHPEGGVDGLTWEFVHVPDGLPARNTRNVRGGVLSTGPFRWTGREREIAGFVQDEITGLLHGPVQRTEVLHAFRDMLHSFPMPVNPYRTPEGKLTEAAERGRQLFTGKAGCATCHVGERAGGTGLRGSVGTTPGEDAQLDVPHLVGVHDSAPYLHDGRARTLEEVFGRHNRQSRHGKAHQLTPTELADLLRYVREL
ncbi:MAG: c-type cytochrome, partial [Actinomycetota bacterium]